MILGRSVKGLTSGLTPWFTVAIALIIALTLSQLKVGVDPFGARDFIAFWSGGRTFLDGANPYDDAALRLTEAKISWLPERHLRVPQQFFNPPWSIPLFLPFSAVPFTIATIIWTALNLLCWFGIALLLAELFKKDKQTIFLGTAVFVYAWYAVMVGQLSLIILFLLLWGIRNFEKNGPTWSAALGTIGIILKPHLFLPLLVWGFCRIGKIEFKILAVKSLLLFCCFWGGAELFHPYITQLWLHREGTPTQWISSSLAALLQTIFLGSNYVPKWPLFVMPLIGAFLALVLSYKKKEALLSEVFPLVLFLGILCAPYAFPYDFIFCLPAVLQMSISQDALIKKLIVIIAPTVVGIGIGVLSIALQLQVIFLIMCAVLLIILSRNEVTFGKGGSNV